MLQVSELNGFGAGGGGAIALSLVGEADVATATITMPGGIAAGDLALVAQYALGSASIGTPSGFTQTVLQLNGVDSGISCWYKVLTGSETTIASGSSGSEISTFCVVFRPSRAISSVLFGTWSKEISTSGNPVAQSVDPTALPAPSVTVGFAAANGGSFNSFGTFTPTADNFYDRDTGVGRAWLGYRIDNVTPQSSTIDMNDEGNQNALVSGYLAVS